MKKCLLIVLASLLYHFSGASDKDSTIYYNLPDSVKAIQYLAEVRVDNSTDAKFIFTGIRTDVVSLELAKYRNGEKAVRFSFPEYAPVVASGTGVRVFPKFSADLTYQWADNKTYKLLLANVTDSADNFSLYTGYVWLPEENKWKLVATCRISGIRGPLQHPAIFKYAHKKSTGNLHIGDVWCQRNNGSWKNLKEEIRPSPLINLAGHEDSARQRQTDIKLIEDAIAAGKTDVKQSEQGVYYAMMKEGSGRIVSLEDTVVVHYKGYLFSDGSVFDQTRDKPATFPLKRLIRGWQVGVPLCKVGGKIKLVIPSDMAYSIRTRAAKIPPNSILVFEVEVVDAKAQ